VRLPGILHKDQVTIIQVTKGLPDADGVPSVTESRATWSGVNVQRVAAEDLTDHERETQVVKYRVSGDPAPVPVDGSDRIEWRGLEYEIEGDPDTRTGRLQLEHTALTMTRTRG
jgi:hypothetical protein